MRSVEMGPPVLSRIAESLFWVGRYLERAEDTSRLLDVEIHHMLEDSTMPGSRAATTLLTVMGLPTQPGHVSDIGEVTDLLAFSGSQPSSVISSLRGARENARGIRESISSELWECLNATIVGLEARVGAPGAVGPHGFFRFAFFVRERVALAVGIADATMSRDDGWRFLLLGRGIERADMTARLLAARMKDAHTSSDWVTTLRSCSAYEAYLRYFRGSITAANALEFLILARDFPRSIHFSLASAESCLAELEQSRGRVGLPGEAERIIGSTRAALGFLTTAELVGDLPNHLLAVQRSCSEATSAIASRYFQREATLPWRREGLPGHVAMGAL